MWGYVKERERERERERNIRKRNPKSKREVKWYMKERVISGMGKNGNL